MALIAALAAALATVCAASATGFPPALVALVLVPGVALVAARPDRTVHLPPRSTKWLSIALGALAFAVLLSLDTPRPSRYLLVLAVAFSALWPRTILATLFAATASLLGAGPSLGAVAVPLAGFAAAAAVSLVAVNRMRGPAGHRLAGRGRGMAADAVALLLVAGVIALLAAALLPSPDTANRPSAGRSPRRSQGQAPPPYLQPANRLDAGGPGTGQGDQVVFRVAAPRTALWRTMTFDEYDGRTWRRSAEVSETVHIPGPTVFVDEEGYDEVDDFLRPPFVQRIRIEAAAVGLLPAAARLYRVELPGRGGAEVAPDGTVAPLPELGRGATYVAASYPPPSIADELRRHGSTTADEEAPSALAGQYLPFPGVPERVVQLARDIAAGAEPTEYDRVHAIESWLRAHTQVALDAPALPPGADPIDQLLFADRRGSSQQAATAMAIMLRSLRIPARIAVGYVSPRPSALGGEMVVRARQAHAWVEAWFPEAGWVAFDPAGRFTAPGEDAGSLWSRLKRLLASLWWVLAVVVVALGGWLGSRWLHRRRQRRSRPWATQIYERIAAAGVTRGRPRRPGETPVEYCAALGAEVDDDALARSLARVGVLVTAAAWSPQEPEVEARAWADDVINHVVDKLQAARGSKHAPG